VKIMTRKNNIKAVSDIATKSKADRDNRSHEEKLNALRETFGRRKEMAKQSGKINDCSINKIAEDARIDKLWLLGHREVKNNPGIKKEYLKIRDQINSFKQSFSPEKDISEDKAKIKDLESQLAGLHASIEPTFIRIAALERKVQNYTKVANDLDQSTTQLIAKKLELEEQLVNRPADTSISNTIPVKRVIISPDVYRKKGGKYVYGDKKIETNAWINAIDQLNKVLTRKLPTRLYVLVGLPCSGKSTWAKSPNTFLETDRHPVIFDATNLTAIERVKLIQPLSRFSDLSKTCVYFDTDMDLIRQCNRESDGWERAKLTEAELTRKLKKLERPDPYEETWIDDLRVVRRR